ncbi:MAG: alpha/beta fold hydrolase [Acidimicrobiia bacterium]
MTTTSTFTVPDDGARLHVRRGGVGEALVLVHGSWTDADSWVFVTPALEERYHVVSYDRRGHTRSERGSAPAGRRRDEDDLAALIADLGAGPVHLVGNSYGASIVLGLTARRPDLLRSVAVHEPPLVALLAGTDDAAEVRALTESITDELVHGSVEHGVARFVEEVALGPGAWALLPEEVRAANVANVDTFLDMLAAPGWDAIDVEALSRVDVPIVLTDGDQTVPWLRGISQRLGDAVPSLRRRTLPGVGHVPHLTHPDVLVDVVDAACPVG